MLAKAIREVNEVEQLETLKIESKVKKNRSVGSCIRKRIEDFQEVK